MDIRKKTILILGITLIALISVLWLLSELMIMGGFSAVEIQSAEKDTNRVLVALGADINWLDAVAVDWASRDRTQEAILSTGEGSSGSSLLGDDNFEQLQFNYIILFNESGGVVAGKGYDLEMHREQPIPAQLEDLISLAPASAELNRSGTGILGIVAGTPTPLLIAVRPVLDGKTSGATAGYILMARYLDEAETSRLAERVQLPVEIQPYDAMALPPDYKKAIALFPQKSGTFISHSGKEALQIDAPVAIQTQGENTLGGYALIRDIYGEPVQVMRVSITRDIYHQGRNTTVFFIMLLVIAGITFGVIIIILLNEIVLSRLLSLNTRVSSIGTERDFSARVPISGNDEVSSLATSVNAMLAELEISQQALHHRLIKSEENYRLFFNSITDPVIIFGFEEGNLSGAIIESNEAASTVLGYSREELLQRNPMDIIRTQDQEGLARFTGSLRSGEYVQYETDYRTKSGNAIPVEVNAQVFDHFGRTAVLAIARDITVRKDIERLKMEAFQQIEQNMQQFAILNDHIRNPLQAIIGIADLMEDKSSEKIIKYAQVINELVHKLDCGYCESEKINEFLRKYYGIGKK
jgi:PAS domain S-box-containing protein